MEKQPCAPMIGADIEHFLIDREARQIVPCVGILPGTKEKPYQHPDHREGFCMQEDNVMAEYNIPPTSSVAEFCMFIDESRDAIDDYLADNYLGKYRLDHSTCSATFQKEHLESPQARTIGCEPDYDAYTGGEMRINPPKPGLTRHCGGHIHLGGNFQCPDFVAALFADIVIGYRGNAVIVADQHDMRRKWYGKPGIYRPKPYGIEYRTPNARWSHPGMYKDTVASQALALCEWLTNGDPSDIVNAFRMVDWPKVRDMMMGKPSMYIHDIESKLRDFGCPV